MSKEIIINADMAEEVRIAIVQKGRLMDLDIETQSRAKHKGNIYKGIISNIEDSLEAVFVDFGEERQGFLPMSEVRPELYPQELKDKKKPKPSEVLARGQEIIVQVTKDEIGNKGAAVTTYLSLPGRYAVLMHSDEGGGGISRKIDSESARKAAREMLSKLSMPEGLAVIIRTAGMTATRQDLLRDFKNLCEAWARVAKGAQLGRAPTLLYREPDIVVRTVRDYCTPDVSKIVIDDEAEYDEAHKYFSENGPSLVSLLERYTKKEPIFQSYGVEKAIEELFQRQVKLPSGGYIIIEQTEALVSVDVNSGKSTREEDHESTVYKTNLEAVTELGRQLRLRDFGGIIIVDLIDMVSGKHKRQVESALKDAMKADRAKIKVGRISENGTLELTRQRLRQSHQLISHVICENCEGTGRVRDASGLAIAALRSIYAYLAKKKQNLSALTVKLPVEVANQLNNLKRRELLELSDSHQTQILIKGEIGIREGEIKFSEERRGQAGLEMSSKASKTKQRGRGTRQPTNLPPPDIGPAPTLIDFDENAPDMDQPLLSSAQMAGEQHFEDPLLEAFFGTAPDMELKANNESEEQDSEDMADGEKPAPKKRRRRFSRSRKPKHSKEEKEASEPTSEEINS